MREGYEKYSDGLWRKVFNVGQSHHFMQVRAEDGTLIETVNGKDKIATALARVRKLTNDALPQDSSSVPPSDVPGQS